MKQKSDWLITIYVTVAFFIMVIILHIVWGEFELLINLMGEPK